MRCDKSALFDFLEVLNEDLPKKITLVAAGGTAMTLLDLKTSTIDIDFTIPGCDRLEFEQVLKNNPPGYKVACALNLFLFFQFALHFVIQNYQRYNRKDNS
jgi:hypothetical protein